MYAAYIASAVGDLRNGGYAMQQQLVLRSWCVQRLCRLLQESISAKLGYGTCVYDAPHFYEVPAAVFPVAFAHNATCTIVCRICTPLAAAELRVMFWPSLAATE